MTGGPDILGGARWRVDHGDALLLLPALPAGVLDAVVADPPYSSGGAMRGDRMASTTSKYCQTGSGNVALGDFLGDTRDQRSLLAWCSLWLAACWAASRDGATLCVFCDWRQLPTMTDAVQAGGWVWRGIVPWNKGLCTRPQMGRPRAQCEYVVFATKGAHAPYDGAPALPGFYECHTRPDRLHITEKPVALLQDIVRLTPPGGLICDPFAGSGTTGEAAVSLGRRALLFELSPKIAEIARGRMLAAESGADPIAATRGQLGLGLVGGAP